MQSKVTETLGQNVEQGHEAKENKMVEEMDTK
jgi:hypothetical protein